NLFLDSSCRRLRRFRLHTLADHMRRKHPRLSSGERMITRRKMIGGVFTAIGATFAGARILFSDSRRGGVHPSAVQREHRRSPARIPCDEDGAAGYWKFTLSDGHYLSMHILDYAGHDRLQSPGGTDIRDRISNV